MGRPRCYRCEDSGWAETADSRYAGAAFARPCSCRAGLQKAQGKAWAERTREPLPELGQGTAEEPF